MSEKHKSAYPYTVEIDQGGGLERGLTKREYFAAQIYPILLNNHPTAEHYEVLDAMAKKAVSCADDLLAALELEL